MKILNVPIPLAPIKLEMLKEAEQCFGDLIKYGERHRDDKMKIDYFAVSLLIL